MKKYFSKISTVLVMLSCSAFTCIFTANADTFTTIESARATVKGVADTAEQRCDISKAAQKNTATEQEKKTYDLLKTLYTTFEDVPHHNSNKLFYVIPNRYTGCENDKYTYSLQALDKRPCHDNMSFDRVDNIQRDEKQKRYRQNLKYCNRQVRINIDNDDDRTKTTNLEITFNKAMIQEYGRAKFGKDFEERGGYELDDKQTKLESSTSMYGGGSNGTVVIYYHLDAGYPNGKYIYGLMVNRPLKEDANASRSIAAMDEKKYKQYLESIFTKKEWTPKQKAKAYCQMQVEAAPISFESLSDHPQYKGQKNVFECLIHSKLWDTKKDKNGTCDHVLKSLVENIQKSNADTTRLGITAEWVRLGQSGDGKPYYGCVITFPEDLKID